MAHSVHFCITNLDQKSSCALLFLIPAFMPLTALVAYCVICCVAS